MRCPAQVAEVPSSFDKVDSKAPLHSHADEVQPFVADDVNQADVTKDEIPVSSPEPRNVWGGGTVSRGEKKVSECVPMTFESRNHDLNS